MSTRNPYTITAVAALAGLAFTVAAPEADAARRGVGGPQNNGQTTVDKGEALDTGLILYDEPGAVANNVFGNADTLVSPDPERFAVRAGLETLDTGDLCQDVDFYRLDGLEPLSTYTCVGSGDIGDKLGFGWYSDAGVLQDSSDTALQFTTDGTGHAWIAVSAATDADFDGDDDISAAPHDLCGAYTLFFEIKPKGDLTGDDAVNIADVQFMLNVIGATDNPAADLNNDGIVDHLDLRQLANLVSDKQARKAAKRGARNTKKKRREIAENATVLAETLFVVDTSRRRGR